MTDMQGSTGTVPPEASRPIVLQVVPDLQDGGLQRSAVDIAEALTAAGAVPGDDVRIGDLVFTFDPDLVDEGPGETAVPDPAETTP